MGALGSAICSVCPNKISACPAGTFRSTNDISCACTACPEGKFTDHNLATSCEDCTPGRFSASAGLTACSTCMHGKFTAHIGAVYCVSCDAGSYSAKAASTTCEMCEAGQYQMHTGMPHCNPCECGEYSEVGSTTCKKCDGSGSSFATCTAQCIAAGRKNFKAMTDALVDGFNTYVAPAIEGYTAAMLLKQVDECNHVLVEGAANAEIIKEDVAMQAEAAAKTLQDAKNANALNLESAKAAATSKHIQENEDKLNELTNDNQIATVQLVARLYKEKDEAVRAMEETTREKGVKAMALATQTAVNAKKASLASAKDSLDARTGIPDGQIPLDIDKNGEVNVQDAVTLFVAQTMAGFGAEDMLKNYRRLHKQTHKEAKRDVADVLKMVQTAITPVHVNIVAKALAAGAPDVIAVEDL